VPAGVGARGDTLNIQGKIVKRNVNHGGLKPGFTRLTSLLKGDLAPQRGLYGKAYAVANVCCYELLKFAINDVADTCGNLLV